MLIPPVVAAGTLAGRPQPRIPGADVVLRPWRPDDADVLAAAYEDPAIRYWHARSMTSTEALGWMASAADRWTAETGAEWAVADPGDDAVLGRIGLRHVDLHEGLAEAAYWVLPAARRRGVAARALEALAGWAFGGVGLHRLELVHSTANDASCRAALRAGFAPEGTLRGQALHVDGWHDMHLHARLAGDRP